MTMKKTDKKATKAKEDKALQTAKEKEAIADTALATVASRYVGAYDYRLAKLGCPHIGLDAILGDGGAPREIPQKAKDMYVLFCQQVRDIIAKIPQRHSICTIYNYLQDRTGIGDTTGTAKPYCKASRADRRKLVPHYAPWQYLKDSTDLRDFIRLCAKDIGYTITEQGRMEYTSWIGNKGTKMLTAATTLDGTRPHIAQAPVKVKKAKKESV